MKLLEKLREEALQSSGEAFARSHPGVYLLGTDPDGAEVDEDALPYATQRVDSPATSEVPAVGPGSHRTGSPALWRLEKTDRNPWQNRIILGRARNNDIVVRQTSISKFHAFFVEDQDQPLGYAVVDAGSRNGTTLDGEPLRPHKPAGLRPGSLIAFGDILCTAHDARSLYTALQG